MGYSCSAKASYTINAIQLLSDFDIKNKEYKYFIEIGRENKDGSITGKVYQIDKDFEDGSGFRRRQCFLKGSFKVDANGKIIRFPGLSNTLWGIAEIASIEQYDRDFSFCRRR